MPFPAWLNPDEQDCPILSIADDGAMLDIRAESASPNLVVEFFCLHALTLSSHHQL